MRYSQIRDMDISNGVGIACSIFFQGCFRHCPGCFNSETWDFNGGKEFTPEIQDKFVGLCKQPHINCISILGGEPFDQDPQELYDFLYRLKHEVGKPIFAWSGYTFYQLLNQKIVKDCFEDKLVDTLIDGEFDLSQRDLTLRLRGSRNQRVIDVSESIDQNIIVTVQD